MSPRLGGWRRDPVPADVPAAIAAHRSAAGAGEGPLPRRRATAEKVLAWASDRTSGARVVAGEYQLYVIDTPPEGSHEAARVVSGKPWHLVDSGSWDAESATLRVTWVDQSRPSLFVLPEANQFPETLRERVQRTVVLSERVDLGDQHTARVVVRQDLQRDVLVTQTILGPGVSSHDPGVLERTKAVLNRLREQVGLD